MSDNIRKAVELADGWELSHDNFYVANDVCGASIERINQPALDALAAQLVRQVDALPVGKFPDDAPTTVYILNGNTDVWHKRKMIAQHEGSDRTMNTINAIVDSGVLE